MKDNVTRFIWQRFQEANGLNHTAAIAYCSALNIGGFTFRLPTVKELSSLLDRKNIGPCIDRVAFPGTASQGYWSSTLKQSSSGSAWVVDFFVGGTFTTANFQPGNVRCVR